MGIAQCLIDDSGDRRWVAGLREIGMITAQCLDGSADPRRDHGDGKRHRLENREWKAFEARGKHEEIGDRHDLRNIRPVPQKANVTKGF